MARRALSFTATPESLSSIKAKTQLSFVRDSDHFCSSKGNEILRIWLFPFTNRNSSLCFTFMHPEGTSTLMVSAGYSILAIFYATTLVIAVTFDSWITRVLSVSPLRRLGTIAYFTYLFHLPAMELCRRCLGLFVSHSATTQFSGGVIGVLLTILVANLSWVLFERPILRIGQRRFTF
jgi:peptidoglycan/LPS O-acetylase OafA/YrhL